MMRGALAGKTIAFSGELMGMTRKDATLAATAAGAKVASAVSGNVDFLVTSPNNGNSVKVAKAQSMGVKILDQPSFTAFTSGASAAFAAPVQKVRAAPKVAFTAAAVMPTAGAVQLAGKSVAITGTLQGATRAQAFALVQAAGATVSNKISASTDYVVCGADATPAKVQAAQMNGIKMISEADFFSATGSKTAAFATPTFEAPVAVAPKMFAKGAVQFNGKTIAFTGSMETGTRAELTQAAHNAGAEVTNKITSNVDYLICGHEPTAAKIQAAQMTGVRMISEAQFSQASQFVAQPEVQAFTVPSFAAPVQRAGRPAKSAAAAPVATMAAPVGQVSLAGKNIVFTGTLQVNRMVAAVMATKAGAHMNTKLGAKTNYLVCGENAGPKLAQAQQLGVQVLSEAQFVAACN